MAHGIKVKNQDGKVILDSSENRPILVKTRTGTASMSTGSGLSLSAVTFASLTTNPALSFNDMIFVHGTQNCFLAEDGSASNTGRGIHAQGGGSLKWFEAKSVNASSIANHKSGYGLNVYDTSGNTAASNLLFSTQVSSSIEIVSIGNFSSIANGTGSAGYVDVSITDGTVDHYILIAGTYRYYIYWAYNNNAPFLGSMNLEVKRGYEFKYTNNVLTTIRLWSASIDYDQNPDRVYGLPSTAAYVIVKLRS